VRHDREPTTRRIDSQVDQLAGVLAQLDQVADDADALNARIEALLGNTPSPDPDGTG
jgi:ubiquinone biosynthesis protein UbiJ